VITGRLASDNQMGKFDFQKSKSPNRINDRGFDVNAWQ